MPAGQGKDAEQRFAAAVERGTPPGYAGDDDLARELEVVALLRSAGPAFAPDPDAKARAKQRLMAMVAEQGDLRRGTHDRAAQDRGMPRHQAAEPRAEEMTAPMGRVLEPSFPTPRAEIDRAGIDRAGIDAAAETTQLPPVTQRQPAVEEADEAAATTPTTPTSPPVRPGRRARHSVASRPAGRPRSSRRPAPSMRRRATLVGTAALVMMFVLTGGGLLASQDALPGDNLYALKRAAESAELALTFDETAKAQRRLQLAETRLSEVEQLISRDRAVTTAQPEVFVAAIEEFDTATDEGSSVLLSAAENDGGTEQLDTLHTWAAEQSARLTELRPALPLPVAENAAGSIQLLDLLLGRTEALGAAPSACSDAEGDCTPRSEDRRGGSDSPDVDTTDSPASPDAESPETPDSETPSGTPTETTGPDGQGLELPNLLPDGLRSGEGEGEGETNGESESDRDRDRSSGDSDESGPTNEDERGLSVPLPLVPPITLPPLLPGMPPITIG